MRLGLRGRALYYLSLKFRWRMIRFHHYGPHKLRKLITTTPPAAYDEPKCEDASDVGSLLEDARESTTTGYSNEVYEAVHYDRNHQRHKPQHQQNSYHYDVSIQDYQTHLVPSLPLLCVQVEEFLAVGVSCALIWILRTAHLTSIHIKLFAMVAVC